jgi:hypothetical protein
MMIIAVPQFVMFIIPHCIAVAHGKFRTIRQRKVKTLKLKYVCRVLNAAPLYKQP